MPTTPANMGVLQIEPTDHCNLACSMCAPHAERWESVHGTPKGYLDPALYERILAGLVADDCAFDHVILQWLGDPSLHPALEELVGRAGEMLSGRVGYLRFDTNAVRMGPERMARLFERRAPDVPLLVVFTVDAATPEAYRRTKGRDELPRVVRHVRRFLAERRRRGAHGVSAQIQFVVQPSNWGEVGDFLRYWEDAHRCVGGGVGFTEVLFKPLSVGGGGPGQAASDALYRRALDRAGVGAREEPGFAVRVWEDRPWQRDDAHTARTACPGLWYTPVVRQDGHLMMCCADLGGELDLGSLADHSFRALWEGPRATAIRMAHLDGRFEGVCAGCGGINWYALAPGDAARTRLRARELGPDVVERAGQIGAVPVVA